MSVLSLPAGENILFEAFRAVADRQSAKPAELVSTYEKHFTTIVPAPSAQPQVFERFSLIDPTIKMIVQSNTGKA